LPVKDYTPVFDLSNPFKQVTVSGAAMAGKCHEHSWSGTPFVAKMDGGLMIGGTKRMRKWRTPKAFQTAAIPIKS